MKVVCIIPSRYSSSRLEGKPLADLCGKPMIQHVYERVLRAPGVTSAAVATDDERIYAAVVGFGGQAVMTSFRHRSGTDRIAEAIMGLELHESDIVVNIQGDQPLFEPSQISEVAGPLLTDPYVYFSTLIYRIRRPEEITHPNAVKVVYDRNGDALYFSRSTIPFVRDRATTDYYKHHGIYAYRKWFLVKFASLEQGRLEKLESLEQLRALEHGYKLRVVETQYDSVEVDTTEELERVKRIILDGGDEIA
jgi:3-deoxy-manno-octulosonate cytidylyltransferase (CMP-KDO synthetase)